jgi:hypothetical protein
MEASLAPGVLAQIALAGVLEVTYSAGMWKHWLVEVGPFQPDGHGVYSETEPLNSPEFHKINT